MVERRLCKKDSEMDWFGSVPTEKNPDNVVSCQGDILRNCNNYTAITVEGKLKPLEVEYPYGVIILTQSCDLTKDKYNQYSIDNVVVCPVYPLAEYWKENIEDFVPSEIDPNVKDKDKEKWVYNKIKKNMDTRKTELTRRMFIGHHILNKCEYGDYNNDYLVVDFRNAFTVDIRHLVEIASTNTDRIRLQSPYVEEMSQEFGIIFMRVALPITIDSKKFVVEPIDQATIEAAPAVVAILAKLGLKNKK